MAFADVGDRVQVEPADRLSLDVVGPFAGALSAEPENLVLRALRTLGAQAGLGDPPLKVTLDKQLPVASGIGGGSADAGAALRAGREALGLDLDDAALAGIAARLGADGPMCLHGRAAWAEGRGDRLTFEPHLPPIPGVLVNPGVAVSTAAVYAALDAGPSRVADHPAPPTDWTASAVIDWLAETGNDLQAPAVTLAPAIADALAELDACAGVRLVRMSGSGATVFGLFDDPTAAKAAADRLARTRPDWWVRPTTVS